MEKFVSKRLKELRLQKNYSQEYLSKSLDISSSAYSRMERGISSTWSQYLPKICNLYDLSISDFFSSHDDNKEVIGNKIEKLHAEVISLRKQLQK